MSNPSPPTIPRQGPVASPRQATPITTNFAPTNSRPSFDSQISFTPADTTIGGSPTSTTTELRDNSEGPFHEPGCICCSLLGPQDSHYPILAREDDDFQEVLDFLMNCSAVSDSPMCKKRPGHRKMRVPLREAEEEERSEIEEIWEDYVAKFRWKLVEDGTRIVCHGSASDAGGFEGSLASGSGAESAGAALPLQLGANPFIGQFGKTLLEVELRKVRQYLETHFLALFPMGLCGSSLSAEDMFLMGSCLVHLDYFLDKDTTSCAFPGLPGRRFTATTVPPLYLPEFYCAMAVKTSLHRVPELSPEEWRGLVLSYFQDRRGETLPRPFRHAILLMETMLQSRVSSPMFTAEVLAEKTKEIQMFYLKLQAKDKEYWRDDSQSSSIPFDYQKGELVGKGTYGAVYRCVNVNNGVFHALKELPWKGDEKKEKEIRMEIDTLKRLSHENIIKYYGCRFDRERMKVSILMEFAAKSLRDMCVESKGLAKPLVIHYARKILTGLAYLHDQGVLHRDIKAANILVTANGEVKLSDFGSALVGGDSPLDLSTQSRDVSNFASTISRSDSWFPAEMTQTEDEDDAEERMLQLRLKKQLQRKQRKDLVGTPLFMAPEIFRGSVPSEATDIWAFGCTLIELLTGKYPWQDLVDQNLPKELIMYKIGSSLAPPALPRGVQGVPEWCEVLQRCLSLDPNLRPSAGELLNAQLFQSTSVTISSRRGFTASPLTSPDLDTTTPLYLKQQRTSISSTEYAVPLPRGSSGNEVCSEENSASRRPSQVSRDSGGSPNTSGGGIGLPPRPNEIDCHTHRRRSRGSVYGTVDSSPESLKPCSGFNGPADSSASGSYFNSVAEII